MKLALEAGHMGTWEWNADTGLLKADANHQALFGLPPQERPQPDEDYLTHMVPEEFRLSVEKAREARSGTDIQQEQRIIRPDGEVRWMFSRGHTKQGSPECMIEVAATYRASACGTESRQSEARLSAMLNQVRRRGIVRPGRTFAVARWRSPACGTTSFRRAIRHRPNAGEASRPMATAPVTQYPGARALRGET